MSNISSKCKVEISYHTRNENHNISGFHNGYWLKNSMDELALSKTRFAGGQKQNRLSRFCSFAGVSLLGGIP